MPRFLFIVLAGLAGPLVPAAPTAAQESASYRIERGVLGALDGAIELQSSGYSLARGSLGAPPRGAAVPASASYTLEPGWTATLRPALEIEGLRFVDDVTLTWSPDPSLGTYRLYRGAVSDVPATPAVCVAETPNPGWIAGDEPAAGVTTYYLVTAVDAAAIEGSAGSGSDGAPRSLDSSCP